MQFSVSDVRFQRLVRHLHSLGERALGEFLAQLAGGRGYVFPEIAAALERMLADYERVTPETLLAISGTLDFLPPPLAEVPSTDENGL